MKLSVQKVVLTLIAASLGAALRSTISLADEPTPIDLAAMVPKTFGEWCKERNLLVHVVSPLQKSIIDNIYSQTLSRTYVNPQAYRIMLSIAYGKNQSDALQLHKPEICYLAQGFLLLGKQNCVLDKSIAATRLDTSLGQRHETVLGDHIVTSGIDKKTLNCTTPCTTASPMAC